ncbi:MAG: glycosyltransferase [Phormidesmis sp.]
MNILMLAPHPFYQPRGTPIAADLVLRVLSERGEYVDLITFPEGSDVHYPHVKIYRTPAHKIVQDIRPGFSLKKIICDVFLLMQAIKLVRTKQYDLIHAGEEAVFIALLLKKLFGIPYVYDMDSSLVQQLIDKSPKLKIFEKVLQAFEGLAVKNSRAVIPVCQALAVEIQQYNPRKVVVIPDISLLNYNAGPTA